MNEFPKLNEFLLNEDLGNISKYINPKLFSVFRRNGYNNIIGPNSKITNLGKNLSKKEFISNIKKLKENDVISIIYDNKPKFLIKRESPRKYNIYDIEKQKPTSYNRNRYSTYIKYDGSANNIYDYIIKYGFQNYNGDNTEIEYIHIDVDIISREKNVQRRKNKDNLKRDPLKIENNRWDEENVSINQQIKNNIIFGKLLKDIEKKLSIIEQKLKNRIEQNFKTVFNNMTTNLKQGYTWYADPKEFGTKLLNGVNTEEFKILRDIYDNLNKLRKTTNLIKLNSLKKEITKLLNKI